MPLINKSYLDSARLITRTPTYIVPVQSEENAIGFLLSKLALMEKEEEYVFTLVEQVLPKLHEGLEDSLPPQDTPSEQGPAAGDPAR